MTGEEKEETENQSGPVDKNDSSSFPELSSGIGFDQTSIAPGDELEVRADTVTLEEVGQYNIVREIGRGGMGCVYEANQTHPVKRKVALKVILAGRDSRHVIARFNAERQALALMDHPTIARILDAGETKQGQPYFAMELIAGVPLTEYCDGKNLSLEERLDIFCQICSGIQHAHQKGVIHRDLKPGNILVTEIDGKPIPKIIDFGLAKALETSEKLTDQTIQTEFGLVLGTIKYMSPEQAGLNHLDIDTRTDIYSLGIILYELLTGSTPLDGNSIRQMALLKVIEMVREFEAPKPSSRISNHSEHLSNISKRRKIHPKRLSSILSGELDWIVMRSLEKDRDRRYPSAGEFAKDIQRYLNNEPIQARPPSTRYRLRKFVSKNRVLVGVVSSIVGLLIAGFAGTSYGLLKANRSAKAEKAARQMAQKREQARSAIFNYLISALGAGDPMFGNFVSEYGIEFDQEASFGEVIRQIAQTELTQVSALQDFPLVKAGVQSQLGDVLFSNGDIKLSLQLQQKSYEIYSANGETSSLDFAKCLTSLASCQFFLGDLSSAEKNLIEATRIRSTFDKESLKGRQLGYMQHSRLLMGLVAFSTWDMTDARRHFERVIASEQHDNISFPLQNALANFMLLRIQQEDPDANESFDLKMIAQVVASVDFEELDGSIAELIRLMANVHTNAMFGREDVAVKELVKIKKIVEARLGNDHYLTLLAKFAVAFVLEDMGKLLEAKLEYESLDNVVSVKLNRHHPIYAFAMYEYGKLLFAIWRSKEVKSIDELEQAKKLMVEAIEVWSKFIGAGHYLTANAMYYLGRIEYSREDFETSLSWLEKCLAIRERYYDTPSGKVAQTHFRISKCYQKLELLEKERESLVTAIEIETKLAAKDNARVPNVGLLQFFLVKNLANSDSAETSQVRELLKTAIEKMKRKPNKFSSALPEAVEMLKTWSDDQSKSDN